MHKHHILPLPLVAIVHTIAIRWRRLSTPRLERHPLPSHAEWRAAVPLPQPLPTHLQHAKNLDHFEIVLARFAEE